MQQQEQLQLKVKTKIEYQNECKKMDETKNIIIIIK